jgi:hypothetical protein
MSEKLNLIVIVNRDRALSVSMSIFNRLLNIPLVKTMNAHAEQCDLDNRLNDLKSDECCTDCC